MADERHLGEKRQRGEAAVAEKPEKPTFERDYEKYNFSYSTENYSYIGEPGLNRATVEDISRDKGEPEWMTQYRLEAYDIFCQKPLPMWGGDLTTLNFNDITYYARATDTVANSWDDVPAEIKETYDRLGIPEAEKKFLAGVGAQYDSDMVYHSLRKDLEDQGVVFLGMDQGLEQYPELVKEYFGSVIPKEDNKFAALNSAVWSGGSFIYVPKGVEVDIPLQAYFRINASNMGQFERTLIIADEGAKVHYIEGCTAPVYSKESLHSAIVELVALPGSHLRYTTLQNWSDDVYNLVTKRAVAHRDATVEWVDANIGSRVTMKYPSIYMLGEGAKADILSVAYAGANQHQDTGGKVIHAAPHTTSTITSKSVSKDGGHAGYRGQLKVTKGAKKSKSSVLCDALLLDEHSRSDTYPYNEIEEDDVTVGHEATVGKVGEDQIFYLQSRGLSESEAIAMIVLGFMEPFTKTLPMEYALEFNRLIQLEMEGSVG